MLEGGRCRMPVALEGFSDVSQILQGGVYALVLRNEVVYIGKAKCMLVRTYTHRNLARSGKARRPRSKTADFLPVKGIQYDQLLVCPCHPDRVDELEAAMIDLYKPRLNVLLKTKGKVTAPLHLNIRGVQITLNDQSREQPPIRRRA